MMRFFILATAILALFSAAAAAAPEPIATQQILGAHIVAANGAPIGRVSDLLCDTRQGRIADFVVSHGDAQLAIPWTPLPSAAPAMIAASAAALTESAPVGDALDGNPALRAVEHDLLGRAAIAADGTPVGHVAGLEIDPQSGTVSDLLIASGASAQAAKELPWGAIADIDLAPIVLAITAAQFAALPTAGAQIASH